MPRISFDEAISTENSNSNSIQYFSLKNDGDFAIVRIMHDSKDSIEIYPTHSITVNGKFRKVACLRGAKDSIESCPLCAANNARGTSVYIKMVTYTTDESGKISATPVIWERTMNYARKIVTLLNDYGPLSDYVFKITRNGAAGSRDTTYDINLANPNVYTSSAYPKVEDAFKDYEVCGTVLMSKSYEDIAAYVQTGNFPTKQSSSNIPNNTPNYNNPQSNAGYTPYQSAPSTTDMRNPAPTANYSQAPQATNWQVTNNAPKEDFDYFAGPNEVPQAPTRPKRFY